MKSRIRQLVSMVCSLALCAALVPAAVLRRPRRTPRP